MDAERSVGEGSGSHPAGRCPQRSFQESPQSRSHSLRSHFPRFRNPQSIVQRLSLRALAWYHTKVSPLFPRRCKYFPTCSQYMEIAIRRFGFLRGFPLGVLRLLRCQPWSEGGIDDVPHRYSLFYRFGWSRAHEEPTTEPILTQEGFFSDDAVGEKDHEDEDHEDPSESREPEADSSTGCLLEESRR